MQGAPIILTVLGMIQTIIGHWSTRFRIYWRQGDRVWPSGDSKCDHCSYAKSLRASCSFLIFICNFFYSNNYLLVSNFVLLMHCICLSWIHPFFFIIFKLCFLLSLWHSTLAKSYKPLEGGWRNNAIISYSMLLDRPCWWFTGVSFKS